jgi:thiosulfate dehydrogenase
MPNEKDDRTAQELLPVISKLMLVIVVLVVALIAMPFVFYYSNKPAQPKANVSTVVAAVTEAQKDLTAYWIAPELSSITDSRQKEQVAYGRDLIAHTSKYLGPNGSVAKISNGMNCQNCHLQAGTAVFGNNYGSVASLYPKFRARSGSIENIYKRVNDCFERSLNGKAIDTAGKEMQAIVAYIKFLGSNVEKGKKAEGSGLKDLALLERAADPVRGLEVYKTKCQSCHQVNGEGLLNNEKTENIYPPLWGEKSFNDGAGLYRLSSFAKYVKYNMPQGVTYKNPQLSDEEAWDVGAFVISQQRPHINVPHDWPDRSRKPFDHPFGPYADSFPEIQHKLGPFNAIIDFQKKKEATLAKKEVNTTVKK